VPGADYATTVYWRPLTWRLGTTDVIAGNTWHTAAATPTRPAVFPADSFNFFGDANFYQQWQAGVEVWRPTLGWESAVAAYLKIRHTIYTPFYSTSYSYSC
jgi:hypothetical protein